MTETQERAERFTPESAPSYGAEVVLVRDAATGLGEVFKAGVRGRVTSLEINDSGVRVVVLTEDGRSCAALVEGLFAEVLR